MTPLRVRPPWHRYLFLLCAAIVAASLLSTYVHLLQESVARGAQWRDDPRAPSGAETAKATNPVGQIT